MQMPEPYFSRGLKPLIFALCLVPVLTLAWQFVHDQLGANPIEVTTRALGEWGLRLLLLTLLISPLRRLTGWTQALRLRRMLGLYAFFYVCLHLFSYIGLDQFFDWEEIWLDILDRPYITIGMGAFLLLIPLAATSYKAAMKRLGRNWQKLHQLIYPIAILGIVHFWLIADSKVRTDRPLIYAIILAVLLGERVIRWRQRKSSVSTDALSVMRT